jgi:hypothetical protein
MENNPNGVVANMIWHGRTKWPQPRCGWKCWWDAERDYIEKMKQELQHWVDAGQAGRLKWGIFAFRKPAG